MVHAIVSVASLTRCCGIEGHVTSHHTGIASFGVARARAAALALRQRLYTKADQKTLMQMGTGWLHG